jgi:hypothetical protein
MQEDHLSQVEEYPTQARIYIEPTTPCASLIFGEHFSIVVSKGSKDSSHESHNSGISIVT